MELRHLRYFLAVAEELNFRRAAERVGIAQPPLSSQIHDLEAELGVRLFRRVPKGAELTEAGAAFLAEVPSIFERVDQAVRMAQRGGRGEVGHLRVGYTGSTSFNNLVPEALRQFRRTYAEVELTLEELNSLQLLDRLTHQRLDAVFIRPGREPISGVAVLPLPPESMMIVVPAEHRLAHLYAVELKDLAGEPLILFSRLLGSALYDEIIDACRRAGFEPIIGQVAPQITSIANLVAVELGVSIVPARMANAAIPGVRFLPIKGDAPVARLALATRSEDRSVITANFVRFVRRAAEKP
ncbi:LysR family transcriptional regulator [Mesorhizobium sp. M7A.F.Ca.US.006.01.1.1]|uniref:LysR family transcriptional regulator n=1 Tax=Mesorhizobium sp. M7A.F.Ca.US.006.01.1.1 TaxID=2496707 RepID=UPI000FCAE071|nr:LysR family transcriptional regulator [Mesorhizobium sp. M7A.F.Ca.US.006.01.1.1]RUZ71623.1 LysR family transcriptional regulator [Mesorhizobium sp. M7A.F.Ca.US.006.01.1.1]